MITNKRIDQVSNDGSNHMNIIEDSISFINIQAGEIYIYNISTSMTVTVTTSAITVTTAARTTIINYITNVFTTKNKKLTTPPTTKPSLASKLSQQLPLSLKRPLHC